MSDERTRDVSRRGRREGRVLRRIALISLALHLFFGVGLAKVGVQAIVTPGVWGVEEEEPVQLTLSEETPPVLLEMPTRPPMPPAERKGNPRPPSDDPEYVPPEGRQSGGGGGDPLARVTRMGVLGKLSGSPEGKRVSSMEGGVVHASDGIAQLLRGVGDVRKATGTSAKGEPGIGWGNGVGSGFGGGVATQRAEDLVASFGDGGGRALVLEKRGALSEGSELPFLEGGGCREEAEIARIVRSHRGGVRGCYNRSLLRNPHQAGEIAVRFIIDPDGIVTAAEILSRTFHDSEMESCILARIRQWRFSPEAGCETVVRYSFHFSSGP